MIADGEWYLIVAEVLYPLVAIALGYCMGRLHERVK